MNLFKKSASDRSGAGDDGSRLKLTREVIIRASLRIVDNEGLEAFSMRRLGAELKANPMAVYYHFPNKAALLDGLVEAVMSEIDLGIDDPSKPVDERIHTAMQEYRRVLLSHPRALRVVTSRGISTQTAFRPVELLLAILKEAGFEPTDALSAVNILAAFVRGAVISQVNSMVEEELNYSEPQSVTARANAIQEMLPSDQFPILCKMMSSSSSCFISFDEEFERGIKALIRGLMDIYAHDKKE